MISPALSTSSLSGISTESPSSSSSASSSGIIMSHHLNNINHNNHHTHHIPLNQQTVTHVRAHSTDIIQLASNPNIPQAQSIRWS